MRNAELDIKRSGGLGTTAVVAPAVQRLPLQLIYINLCVARQPYVLSYIGCLNSELGLQSQSASALTTTPAYVVHKPTLRQCTSQFGSERCKLEG